MTPVATRRMERLGTLATAVVPVGAAVALVFLLQPQPPWKLPQVNLNVPVITMGGEQQSTTLSDLAVIWQRDLRQPLVDPPPPEPSPPAPEPQLAIKLLGTAVEADQQFGLFQLSDGTTQVRPVGGDVDGCTVISIERGKARLRRNGRDYELTVPWYDQLSAEEDDGP